MLACGGDIVVELPGEYAKQVNCYVSHFTTAQTLDMSGLRIDNIVSLKFDRISPLETGYSEEPT